jgi:hypothetical protein
MSEKVEIKMQDLRVLNSELHRAEQCLKRCEKIMRKVGLERNLD